MIELIHTVFTNIFTKIFMTAACLLLDKERPQNEKKYNVRAFS